MTRPIDGDEGFYTTAVRLVWEAKFLTVILSFSKRLCSPISTVGSGVFIPNLWSPCGCSPFSADELPCFHGGCVSSSPVGRLYVVERSNYRGVFKRGTHTRSPFLLVRWFADSSPLLHLGDHSCLGGRSQFSECTQQAEWDVFFPGLCVF